MKTIRLVVPYTPGGTADMLARTIGQKMAESLGQQGIIDNRPGAGGNIGADLAAKAAPDGYTILMGTVATHAINPNLYPNMPYDAAKDFAPIILPGLPTLSEGGLPGFSITSWFALFAPAGTPAKILDRLNKEAGKAIAMKELRQRWLDQGIEPAGSSAEQLAAFRRTEAPRWEIIVRESGARVE